MLNASRARISLKSKNMNQAKRLNSNRFNTIFCATIILLAIVMLAICTAPTGSTSTTAFGASTQAADVIVERPNEALQKTLPDLSIEIESAVESVGYQGPTASCCGKKPAFSDPSYSSVFTGQVAVTTSFGGQGTSFVLEVIDLKNQSTMPMNTGPPTVNPAMYHGPAGAQWTKSKLGNIFGLTLDNQGNIYVTATTAYSGDFFPGGATGGEVYKINGVTGVVSTFQTLPNTKNAGLGNINYDCAHQRFYVSDIDNGLIYSLDTSGAIQSTWDHGVNLSTPILDNSATPFTALGRRVWGIQAYNGRLYYGVWWEDGAHVSASQNNEVWSVGLLPNGNIVGPAQKEISLPPRTGNETMPISDISFGLSTMLLAERSMTDETNPVAHQSRILEYTLVAGVWTLLNPNKYRCNPNRPQSAAGGVDYDFTALTGLVWASGDALHFPPTPVSNPPESDMIYGIEGLDPINGGDTHTSILIDEDGVSNYYKTQLGDVEIPCPEAVTPPESCAVKIDEVSCNQKGTGGYDFTFTVTNNSGKPVTNVLLTPPLNSNFSITPQSPPLQGGVIPSGGSMTFHVTITGGQPGSKVCFAVTLMTQDGPCCTVEVCPELPNCCAVAENVTAKCSSNGSYSYVLSIVNTSPNTIQHIYLYPPAGVTMTPSYFAVSLPPGAPFQTTPITITGAHSGSFCFRLSLHTKGMKDCCSGDQCVSLPDCPAK